MHWYNEPEKWTHIGDIVTLTTQPDTDFWRKTLHDYLKDDGHFYYQAVSGEFTVEVKVSGACRDLYDQAGLMVRLDENRWMKTGIEYVEGVQYASVVVTREFSDWSVVRLTPAPDALWLRVKRIGNALEVYYSVNGTEYALLRQAYFPPEPVLQAGVMACSPRGQGFEAKFEGLHFT